MSGVVPPGHAALANNATDALGEALDMLMSKHADYGPNNIALAPGGPLNGLHVRLYDKIQRLSHLLGKQEPPRHESLEDTFMDILNYGLIGVLVLRKQWPNT